MKTIASALWYLDPHHDRLKDRSCEITGCFAKFKDYNNWKRKKEKKPQISFVELDRHVQALSGVLSQPWCHKAHFKRLQSELLSLDEVMKKYGNYLRKHSESMKLVHASPSPVRDVEDNILLEFHSSVSVRDPQYSQVQQKLMSLPLYTPVFVNDYAPIDRFVRKHWVDKLQVEFSIQMYRYCHGNCLGTMTFVWRVPTDSPEDPTSTAKAIADLNSKQKLYCTRQMRKDFLSKYRQLIKAPVCILRHL